MSRVLTNNSSFSVALEAAGQIGTLPGTPSWLLLEPNNANRVGAEITTVPRRPISRNRQNRKGAVTDLDSGFEAELDLTREHLLYFLPPTLHAVYVGPRYYVCTGVTSTGYTVAANGDLPANTLIVTTGFTTEANNSPETFKVVTTGSTGTEIRPTGGATAETIPADGSQNALVEVAGRRFASGDLTLTVSGGVVTLGATAVDFVSDLRLQVGQFIGVGGSGTNAFATAANRGIARISSIASDGQSMVLDKITAYDGTATTFVTDAGAGRTVDLYFGRWIRNVAVGHADYLEQSLTAEVTLVDLGGSGQPRYVYARGNLIHELVLGFSGQDKATMSFNMIGLDTDVPTATQAAEADTPRTPRQVAAFNTAADFSRLRVTEVDETGVTSDFIDLTLTLGNNVSPEKVLGTLGARYMNMGIFDVRGECNVVLTDAAVMEAVRTNQLMTAEIGFRNTDGAFIIDFPSITLGNGLPEFSPDESVKLPLTLAAVQDTTFGYTMSVSCLPYVPAS
jgi:hypothetical protein